MPPAPAASRLRRRPRGVSRPGPCLTTGGRLVVLAAGAAALFGLAVPPVVFAAVGLATVADVVVAVVWFRPTSMVAALPAQAVDGTPVRCVLDHPGLSDQVLLTVDHSLTVGPWAAEAGGRTTVDVQAPRRGVFPALSVRGLVVGPLGLGGCLRGWMIPLAVPHVVVPRTRPTDDRLAVATSRHDETSAPSSEAADHLREYRPGDPVHTVNWPASERYGELLVRSGRGPRPLIRMAVHLGPRSGETAEAVASRAMDVGRRHLLSGAQLVVDVVVVRAEAGDSDRVSAYRAPPLRAPPTATLQRARSTVGDIERLGMVLAHAVAAPATADRETGRRWPGTIEDGHYDVIVTPTPDEIDAMSTPLDRAPVIRRPPPTRGSS